MFLYRDFLFSFFLSEMLLQLLRQKLLVFSLIFLLLFWVCIPCSCVLLEICLHDSTFCVGCMFDIISFRPVTDDSFCYFVPHIYSKMVLFGTGWRDGGCNNLCIYRSHFVCLPFKVTSI